MGFIDRADAGRHLAQRLWHLRGTDVAVLGLPRGGVPVAFEVAEELRAPLDVIVVRKLGLPGHPEFGFGAIGEDGARVIDDRVIRLTELTRPQIAAVEARERTRLEGCVRQLRGDRTPILLAGRPVIVVDDGMATGSTACAACLVARARGASRVILAVPVGSVEAVASLWCAADEVICLHTPASFSAISEWYDDFSQVSTEEVTVLLAKAAGSPRLEGDRMKMFGHRKTVTRADRVKLAGALAGIGMAPGVSERACCCPARPLVRVMMPATATRPEPVDLLLCGHHYRASQAALHATGASVYDEQGELIMVGTEQRRPRRHQTAAAA